ncbi:hypothetical protein FLAG1_04983 [Fusarium langsethiae]|uniref:Uncharacterized protein n=1 Tax=Fusarium langsethiae TaxID=179993 RepID=A0A0M9EYB4_FUSLA|nr:hypothetical protein FLAG1_04983 [Fusarium langsethiae]GKT98955.1 unnamed protein product [Fusarium langsethiae]GKU15425.1 unnamed protein product [Fusarium langsethiae]
MARESWREHAAQQQGGLHMQQIIRIKKPKPKGRLNDQETISTKSTEYSQRRDTLSVLNGGGGGIVLISIPVNETRMRSTCSRWLTLPSLGHGHKRLQIETVNFQDDKAKDALRAVIDIIHRKNDGRHYTNASPRLLFYSALIHESLGAPHSISYPEYEQLDMSFPQYFSFFPLDSIRQDVFKLSGEVKYLYRVRDWLLLALVAEKLKLEPIMNLVRDNMVLFCKADQTNIPSELRHRSMNDYEWALIKGLRLIDDRMLKKRLPYLETIFHGLRLLSHQVESMDKGILPTREQFDVYEEYKVAACPECYLGSSEDFHQLFSRVNLWPIFSSSHTIYQGSVVDVIRKIRDIEENLVDEANQQMPPNQHERECNQLTHFYQYLRNFRKELFY